MLSSLSFVFSSSFLHFPLSSYLSLLLIPVTLQPLLSLSSFPSLFSLSSIFFSSFLSASFPSPLFSLLLLLFSFLLPLLFSTLRLSSSLLISTFLSFPSLLFSFSPFYSLLSFPPHPLSLFSLSSLFFSHFPFRLSFLVFAINLCYSPSLFSFFFRLSPFVPLFS